MTCTIARPEKQGRRFDPAPDHWLWLIAADDGWLNPIHAVGCRTSAVIELAERVLDLQSGQLVLAVDAFGVDAKQYRHAVQPTDPREQGRRRR